MAIGCPKIQMLCYVCSWKEDCIYSWLQPREVLVYFPGRSLLAHKVSHSVPAQLGHSQQILPHVWKCCFLQCYQISALWRVYPNLQEKLSSIHLKGTFLSQRELKHCVNQSFSKKNFGPDQRHINLGQNKKWIKMNLKTVFHTKHSKFCQLWLMFLYVHHPGGY